MRIINQRRNHSVDFDNIRIYIDDTNIFASCDCKIILGVYNTKERAQEVFNEIHKAYTGVLEIEEEMEKMNRFEIDKMPKIERNFIFTAKPEPAIILPRNTVYEMPIS